MYLADSSSGEADQQDFEGRFGGDRLMDSWLGECAHANGIRALE